MRKGTEEYGAQGFFVKVEQLNNIAVIRFTGELDANTAVAADDALSNALQGTQKHLLIDCQELRYISSAGVGVLLSTLHACTEKQIRIIFCGLQPKIKNVFAILGLEQIITQATTQEEALQHIQATARPVQKNS